MIGHNLGGLMRQSTSGTFGATGQSLAVQFPRMTGDVQLSGTFAATVYVQRSLDEGATWVNISDALTAPGAYEITDPRGGWLRVACTAYTSGTVSYDLGAGFKS